VLDGLTEKMEFYRDNLVNEKKGVAKEEVASVFAEFEENKIEGFRLQAEAEAKEIKFSKAATFLPEETLPSFKDALDKSMSSFFAFHDTPEDKRSDEHQKEVDTLQKAVDAMTEQIDVQLETTTGGTPRVGGTELMEHFKAFVNARDDLAYANRETEMKKKEVFEMFQKKEAVINEEKKKLQDIISTMINWAHKKSKPECAEYFSTTTCGWTSDWNCPESSKKGEKGEAGDDGSQGYFCCCEW